MMVTSQLQVVVIRGREKEEQRAVALTQAEKFQSCQQSRMLTILLTGFFGQGMTASWVELSYPFSDGLHLTLKSLQRDLLVFLNVPQYIPQYNHIMITHKILPALL